VSFLKTSSNKYTQTYYLCCCSWWLVRHPAYVTAGGHTECAARLSAASPTSHKFMKRSKASHVEHARGLELLKRDATLYHIIATDHLGDMQAKAIGANVISTPGNYQSQNLEPFDSVSSSLVVRVLELIILNSS